MVFGTMLLFIYNLTRIFYEKLLSLCQNYGAEWKKREIAIGHNCKAQLIPLFYPQVCNCLIVKGVYILHRKLQGWSNPIHFIQTAEMKRCPQMRYL